MNENESALAGLPLLQGEPAPAWVHKAGAPSPFLLICDHAGLRIPASLHGLGLAEPDRGRHIAWDIGIAGLGRRLAEKLDATCIGQTYSRLVIDCNRTPRTPESVVSRSDGTAIPGNIGLNDAALARREREIFAPYHACIVQTLDQRAQRGQPTALILLHSFTPVYGGQARAWHAGVLYSRDARLARPLLQALRATDGLVVGDNQPYSALDDDSDYALPQYGLARGLPHVELEIRQDLIDTDAGQDDWAQRLGALLPPALQDSAH